jgi:hypothetical protein
MIIPSGTTAQQPSNSALGMVRFNIETNRLQFYNINGWTSIGGLALASISATGGNSTSDVDGYRIHTFTSSGTFTVSSGGICEVLVVAGGGGGGNDVGGGGGAGGLIYNTSFFIAGGTYPIVVGSGGPGGLTANASSTAQNGQNSSFSTLIAIGGGGGGNWQSAASGYVATNGGSGGGASGYTFPGQPGTGTVGQGNNGGIATNSSTDQTGAGGGGAGGKGSNALIINFTGFVPGGIGVTLTISGIMKTYATGGRGAGNSWTGGVSADANTGNGGDGRGTSPEIGNSGGSGIVVIRYLI